MINETTLNIKEFLDQDEKKDLLRLLTAGSVDDGKSTLIGRLLFDSKRLYEDQLSALERDSKRVGHAGEDIDYALLLDGLKAEREQGITIDVAYRYFSTNKRKFIIADTPGHEQYTRNMITGGSTANLAILLVDARHGVITQTKRHTFLVNLLGIRHVVVAINKMDLVNFSQETFDKIVSDYKTFITGLNIPDVNFIPMSALKGDNVVDKSDQMHGIMARVCSNSWRMYMWAATATLKICVSRCNMSTGLRWISVVLQARWLQESFAKVTK